MNKKEYLSKYLLQNAVIHRLNEMIVLFPENRDEYIEKIRQANDLRRKIENEIDSMQNDVLKELLYIKYICGKSLAETAYMLNYSVRHTERLHKKALENFKIE